jgi:hypothetical protein
MFEKSTNELAADIEKWAVKELELGHKLREAAEGIPIAEAVAGAAILDGTAGDSLAGLLRARAESAAIEAAVRACRGRRLEAVKAKRAADARIARKEAARLCGQIEGIAGKVAEHLRAVAEIERTQFGAPPLATGCDLPLTEQLRMQLDALERRIAGLEVEVPRDGTADISDARGADALVEAVLRHESDGPSAQDVLAWAAACEKRGRASRQEPSEPLVLQPLDFGERSRNFHLAWRNGEIDYAESYVQVPSLIRTQPARYSSGVTAELGSDLFRCSAPTAA